MECESKERLFSGSFIFICIANFLLFMGFYMLLPVLPLYLIENFKASNLQIGVVMASYTVSSLLVRPFSGFVADMFERKPVYLIAYFAFVCVFLSYPLVVSVLMFGFIRILHGLTFGSVSTAGNTLVIDIMPSSRRGEGLGYFGIANNIAMATGPMTGLFLHSYFHSFNVIFYVAAACGCIGFIFATLVESGKKNQVLSSSSEPISFDRFFLVKGAIAGLSLMMLSMPYGMITSYMPLYAKELGVTINAGLFFTIQAISLMISRVFSGKEIDKGKNLVEIKRGTVILGFAFFLFSIIGKVSLGNSLLSSVLFFIVPSFLGLGYGMIFPSYNILFVNLGPNNRRATANSSYLTSWDFGLGLGLVSGGKLADFGSYGYSFVFGDIVVFISLIIFIFLVVPHYNKYRYR